MQNLDIGKSFSDNSFKNIKFENPDIKVK